jgi:opacity protein-like surface antigen
MSNGSWRGGGGMSADAGLGGEDPESGFGLGLSAGYNLGYLNSIPIRVEAEYVYRGQAEFGAGPRQYGGALAGQNFKVSAHSLLANIFFDIPTQTALTPYFGGGLGLAYLDTDYSTYISDAGINSVSSSSNDLNFAWNLGGGMAWSLNDSIALDMGYRYVDLGKADSGNVSINNFTSTSSTDYTAHEVSLGLRISGF